MHDSTDHHSMMPFISRRAVLNDRLQITAYILQASGHRKDTASAESVLNNAQPLMAALKNIAIERLAGKQPVLIAFDQVLLTSPPPFNRQQLIVQVANSCQLDATTLHALMLLREKGYSIALDDFTLNAVTECLVAYADIIIIDVSKTSSEILHSTLDYAKLFGLTTIAKNIKSYSMFNYCKAQGFNRFEGSFLMRPLLSDERFPASYTQTTLDILAVLHNTNAPLDKIEQAITRDSQLSRKILHLVNSAATGVAREIESLRQAMMLIGLIKLKNMANVLLLANIKGKSRELLVSALIRARFCENISLAINVNARSDTYFTVGIASTFDAFLDTPLENILQKIQLNPMLCEAIFEGKHSEGEILTLAKHYEAGNWKDITEAILKHPPIDQSTLTELYIEAIDWSNDMLVNLGVFHAVI